MDSEEEEEEGGKPAEAKDEKKDEKEEKRDEKKDEKRKRDDDKERDSGGEEDVSIESLDMVQTFGRMMVLSDTLLKKLRSGKMPGADIVAACRALGRTKFFDGDMLKELNIVLRRLIQRDQLTPTQINDIIMCLWSLNAYDQGVFTAIANAYKGKTAGVDPGLRANWVEIYRSFNHDHEKDFLQLLEVPPLTPVNPGYQRLRCHFHSRGTCHLDKNCSYSHDSRAPISLEATFAAVRSSPLVMTQNQYTMGRSIYGGARNGQFGK